MRICAVEVETTTDVLFTCAHCEVEIPAEVDSVGHGRGPTTAAAEQSAYRDAEDRALDTLLFVACPDCGELADDRTAFWVKTALNYVLTAVACLALFLFIGWRRGLEGDMLPFAGIVFGCGLLLVIFYSLASFRGQPWKDAEARTFFLDEE